jgi:hypothetical protein
MTRKHLLAGLAAAALMALAVPAEAAPVEFTEGFSVSVDTAWVSAPAPAALAVVALPVTPAAEEPDADPALSEPAIAQDELADLAGQGDGSPIAVLTEQSLTALNSGNAVIGANVGSGSISIDANAFSGFDGIGNFVINSGHNNTLQSSLSVSIVLAPGGN